ncbi:MAG: respiratory nitrate reductase subunit gamma, partial [bacterium]
LGVIGLLIKRITDSNVRAFTTFATIFNLVFLLVMFASGAYAALSMANFSWSMAGFIKALITVDLSVVLAFPAALHVTSAALFFIYLPFTYMMHFVAKYFTYHEVRWNDEPMKAGGTMENNVKKLLGQTVTWSAPHLMADGRKNWVDIASQEDKHEKSEN